MANRIRTGAVGIRGLRYSPDVSFGGYQQSDIGRATGVAGFEEHLKADLAGTCRFLVSDDVARVTGNIFNVGGGQVMRA